MVILKRAGQEIGYTPWKIALEELGVVDDMGMDIDLFSEVVDECIEWLDSHFDEPEDIEFEAAVRKPMGIRPAGRTMQVAPVQRQPVTGVVSIRSFLRK